MKLVFAAALAAVALATPTKYVDRLFSVRNGQREFWYVTNGTKAAACFPQGDGGTMCWPVDELPKHCH